jgi:ankyrin repeat protein
LHLAVVQSARKVLALLLRRGAALHVEDGAGATPLYYAASVQNRDLCSELLKAGARIDPRAAIYLEGPAAVQERLEAGPDVLGPGAAQRLLGDAVRVGSAELVAALLRRGADPNRPSFGRSLPLHQAVSERHPAVVRALLEAGASVQVADHVGRPLLQFCTVYGAPPEIIDLLRGHGAES